MRLLILFCSLWLSSGAFATSVCLPIKSALDRMCARDVSGDAKCGFPAATAPADDMQTVLAWTAESCVYASRAEIPAEVLVLPRQNALLPNGLVEKYGAAALARAIVYRRFQLVDRPLMSATDVIYPAYVAYDNAYPLMAIEPQLLPSIIAKGFLNQHQTGTSNGTLDGDRRSRAETFFSSLVLESPYVAGIANPLNSVRPKYSYAAFLRPGVAVTTKLATQYGSTLVAFKSDVKKRAFFTNRDSLGAAETAVAGFRQNTYYLNLNRYMFRNIDGNYNESQIWGPLTMKDVKYILEGCIGGSNQAIVNHLAEDLRLAHLDIPIYECKSESLPDGSFTRYVPGRQLFGTPVVQTLPKLEYLPVVKIDSAVSGAAKPADVLAKVAAICTMTRGCRIRLDKNLMEPASAPAALSVTYHCSTDPNPTVRKAAWTPKSTRPFLDISCQ